MALDIFSMTGKVAIVTGASYGLGVVFAMALAEAGADLVLTARSEDKLEATRTMIEGTGRRALAVRCDVNDYDQVEALMQTAWDHFGTVDVLVNNAGISDARGHRSENSEPEMFKQLLETDLIGLWYCCRAAAQHFLRQGHGNIINISSFLGLGGFEARTPGYVAAKGGVNSLTRMLATEWGDRGVRVNAIAPHFFQSEMTREILAGTGLTHNLEGRAPMRRIGESPDLVGPIVFLASDASSFITGQILAVDGGISSSMGFHPGPFVSDVWEPGKSTPVTPETPWPSA
jgi:NAD(P)-dependent dehydrogenase (short-subunit alcohol dehydrogenase family)